jgi:Type I restriction enzyme R protein N terminus (HSDR_N)
MIITLDLLKHSAQLIRKKEDGKVKFFDPIRKKYIIATPEESVRQLLTLYLLEEMNYPKNFISIEKMLIINGLQKRFDMVVFNQHHAPMMIVECKAPTVPLTDDVFRQAAIYNMELKAPYLLITNGAQTYCAGINMEEKKTFFLNALPDWEA